MFIEAIILIAIGFILLFIELFVLPSFGPIGILGILLMVAGFGIVGYKASIQTAIVYAGITIAIALPICVVGFWLMPKTKFGKSLILNTSELSESGFKSNPDHLENFIGRTGIAWTSLRPSGVVKIDDARLDVVTQGEFINRGREVEVIKIEGSKIIVREL